jgi:hypothetical protein
MSWRRLLAWIARRDDRPEPPAVSREPAGDEGERRLELSDDEAPVLDEAELRALREELAQELERVARRDREAAS